MNVIFCNKIYNGNNIIVCFSFLLNALSLCSRILVVPVVPTNSRHKCSIADNIFYKSYMNPTNLPKNLYTPLSTCSFIFETSMRSGKVLHNPVRCTKFCNGPLTIYAHIFHSVIATVVCAFSWQLTLSQCFDSIS